MRGQYRAVSVITPLAILIALIILAAPALAGNSVTVIGEIPAVPAPVAQFSASPLSGSDPLTVAFTDQSTGSITSWTWDFDNNGVIDSNVQNPRYTYAVAGTYTVKLTVTGPGGTDDEVKANYIMVTAPVKPVAAFTAAPTAGYAPLTVQFTDESVNNPTSWKWEYRRGSGSWTQFSTAQNPTYTFPATGTYRIRLTATNAAGSNTLTKNNYITVSNPPKPMAEFTGTPTSGNAPLSVQFTDQSSNNPTSWKWEYRKGSGSWTQFSTAKDPAFTFTAIGTYSIRLTATNAGGSNTATKTNYITVTSLPAPVATFSSTPTSGTSPLTVQFTDESTNNPTSWKWEYRRLTGSWTQFSTAKDPSYTFADAGIYSIRLTVTNEGGSDTLTKPVCFTVLPLQPIALFTQDNYLGRAPLAVQFTDRSLNEPTSWYWQFGDGGTSTEQNPSHIYTRSGIYIVQMQVTNDAGSSTAYGIVVGM